MNHKLTTNQQCSLVAKNSNRILSFKVCRSGSLLSYTLLEQGDQSKRSREVSSSLKSSVRLCVSRDLTSTSVSFLNYF